MENYICNGEFFIIIRIPLKNMHDCEITQWILYNAFVIFSRFCLCSYCSLSNYIYTCAPLSLFLFHIYVPASENTSDTFLPTRAFSIILNIPKDEGENNLRN